MSGEKLLRRPHKILISYLHIELTMKLPSLIHLVVSAASAHAALLKAYEQCGGLSWKKVYECESGYNCNSVGGDAFPNYQCLPSFGSVVPHLFPYAQCGGQEFRGSTICAYGWDCNHQPILLSVSDEHKLRPSSIISYAESCRAREFLMRDEGEMSMLMTEIPIGAGSAIARGQPAVCILGFTCSSPGVYGYEVCQRSQSASTSASVSSSAPAATLKMSTTSTKSTSKSTSKSST
ncbi:uncharacterized protein RAG0_04702 [Rhynchosporium agropyri]|uniref:CBM1 domain-containing protein n=1 Tax=Rhynchosporium agropyri TaxID=914238 RepID=A0A1E1KAA7_9HELO|nr:uncharacterized protein RAG0_04702 [Rhynchosporium agropyri]